MASALGPRHQHAREQQDLLARPVGVARLAYGPQLLAGLAHVLVLDRAQRLLLGACCAARFAACSRGGVSASSSAYAQGALVAVALDLAAQLGLLVAWVLPARVDGARAQLEAPRRPRPPRAAHAVRAARSSPLAHAARLTFSLPEALRRSRARGTSPRCASGCPVGMSSAPASGDRPVIVSSVPAFCSRICIVTMRAPPPTTSCPSSSP